MLSSEADRQSPDHPTEEGRVLLTADSQFVQCLTDLRRLCCSERAQTAQWAVAAGSASLAGLMWAMYLIKHDRTYQDISIGFAVAAALITVVKGAFFAVEKCTAQPSPALPSQPAVAVDHGSTRSTALTPLRTSPA